MGLLVSDVVAVGQWLELGAPGLKQQVAGRTLCPFTRGLSLWFSLGFLTARWPRGSPNTSSWLKASQVQMWVEYGRTPIISYRLAQEVSHGITSRKGHWPNQSQKLTSWQGKGNQTPPLDGGGGQDSRSTCGAGRAGDIVAPIFGQYGHNPVFPVQGGIFF